MKAFNKTVIFAALFMFLAPSVFANGLFRNIASFSFDYYSDERYGIIWEEVFITPLPRTIFLVTAVGGENMSFSDVTNGRLGLAFDLPGYYYGEVSYSLEGDWDTQDLSHSVFLSGTYESGPALASLSLTGEFSDEVNGAVASPSLKYFLVPQLSIDMKLFIAFHNYNPGGNFFNFAVLSVLEYALDSSILFSVGGTYGTEYNPDFEYGKWSVLSGIRIVPSNRVNILTQFEYSDYSAHPANPHEIYSLNIVTDFKFGSGEKRQRVTP